MNESSVVNTSRPGDSGYNNPSRYPKTSRKVSAAEQEAFDRMQKIADEPHPETESGPDVLPLAYRILSHVRRIMRTALLIALILAVVLGLYLYAAALHFFGQVSQYPVLLQLPVWALLAVVILITFYSIIRFAVIWIRLSGEPQLAIEQTTTENAELTRLKLTQYLRRFQQIPDSQSVHWHSLWNDAPGKDEVFLEDCRKLSQPRHITTQVWLEEFQYKIAKPLDEIASRRIRYYWKLAGLKTAISPFALIDAAAVLYCNFLMIGDLAMLYGRRIPRSEVIILLFAIIFQVFVAAKGQELMESATEDISTSIESITARSVIGLVAPKVAEGVVNAVLTNRIGKRAQRLFKPLSA